MRIQKFLRDMKVGSLRKCDELVQTGKVWVNGSLLEDPTANLKEGDVIKTGGQIFTFKTSSDEHLYLKLHKPEGHLSTHSDPQGRPVIFDLIKNDFGSIEKPLFFSGRLDKDSRGLMILSTDGNFIQALGHPSGNHTKEYIIKADREVTEKRLKNLSSGFTWENLVYRPFSYEILGPKKVKITVTEGRKHIVRNIIKSAGAVVTDLLRTRIGPYELGRLGPGKCISFSPDPAE